MKREMWWQTKMYLVQVFRSHTVSNSGLPEVPSSSGKSWLDTMRCGFLLMNFLITVSTVPLNATCWPVQQRLTPGTGGDSGIPQSYAGYTLANQGIAHIIVLAEAASSAYFTHSAFYHWIKVQVICFCRLLFRNPHPISVNAGEKPS